MFSRWIGAIKAFILDAINLLCRAKVKEDPESNVDPITFHVPADRIPKSVASLRKLTPAKREGILMSDLRCPTASQNHSDVNSTFGPRCTITFQNHSHVNMTFGPRCRITFQNYSHVDLTSTISVLTFPTSNALCTDKNKREASFLQPYSTSKGPTVNPEFVKLQYGEVAAGVDFPPTVYLSLKKDLYFLDLIAIATAQ